MVRKRLRNREDTQDISLNPFQHRPYFFFHELNRFLCSSFLWLRENRLFIASKKLVSCQRPVFPF